MQEALDQINGFNKRPTLQQQIDLQETQKALAKCLKQHVK